MDLKAWLNEFKRLHKKAHQNALTPDELEAYLTGRNELARALLGAQSTALQPGQKPRDALRVARALPIELDLRGRMRMCLTMDISVGGFAVIIDREPPAGQSVAFTLKMPGGAAPVTGEAKCVQAQPRPGGTRCSFQFEVIGSDAKERIEMLVFDSLLEQMKI